MAFYRLDLLSAAGVKFAELADFDFLACSMAVNRPGMLQAQLRGAHSAIASLEHRSQVELWRRDADNDIDWYRQFGGLYLAQHHEQPEAAQFLLTASGYLWLLATRIVNWSAETANRTKFIGQPAETIMKALVDYNAGANATVVNWRKRAGTITGISVAADTAAGTALDWYCFGDNLLETLAKLADVGGGDYELAKTAAAAWEFRWHTGQLGTDRTATVIFALERGNMGEPVYDHDRVDEKTVACVWGQGEAGDRAYTTRTGADYAADNDIEAFVDAKDCDTTAGLEDRGDQKLDESQARESFEFKVLQTPSCAFGLHYFLGDLISVRNPFTGANLTQKIIQVSLGLAQDGGETIDVELSTP